MFFSYKNVDNVEDVNPSTKMAEDELSVQCRITPQRLPEVQFSSDLPVISAKNEYRSVRTRTRPERSARQFDLCRY